VGGAILRATSAVHFPMFVGGSFACSIGQAVVMQNFIGSLFNGHLSTVAQGMLYGRAVGLLGGIVQRARNRSRIAKNLASRLEPVKRITSSRNRHSSTMRIVLIRCLRYRFRMKKLQIKTMMRPQSKRAR
jgi:hypothetical protein